MPNIALVVLDTLRKDAFDAHFDWLPGQRFERAYSTSNWTVPAHASLFTGRYASEVAVHAKDKYLDCRQSVLAERLAEAGYTTRAFSANTNITGHFQFDRGFNQFLSPERQRHLSDPNLFDWRAFNQETDRTGLSRYVDAVKQCVSSDCRTLSSLVAGARMVLSDGDGTEYGGTVEAIERLSKIPFGENEFLFINVMEAHEPYRVPESYRTVEEPALTNSIGDLSFGTIDEYRTQTAYDDCARYLADIYQDLFNLLEPQFDYIITLSDHGELLGEHGVWGHEYGLYPELTHVPLVVSGEGFNGTCETPVSLLDAHRTVLELAGVEVEDGHGQSLGSPSSCDRLTEFHGLTSWSRRKLDSSGRKDALERYDAERYGCVTRAGYGYETSTGVETTGNLSPEAASKRIEALSADRVIEESVGGERDELPDDVKRQLKDLGYA